MHETITLTVAGRPFTTWAQMTVQAGVKDAERTLSFSFVDRVGAPAWPQALKDQPEAVVKAGADLIFTGHVHRVAPRIDPDTYQIAVEARSAAQDMIDGAVDHTRPDYVKSDVHKVAKDQDKYNCRFTCDFTPAGFDRWRPNPGASLMAELEPLCREEDATLAGQPDGSVKITRAGANAPAQGAPLIEGQNIVQAAADFDVSGQHSKVTALGQAAKGTGSQATQIKAEATNGGVKRERPLVIHHDQDTTRSRLKNLAARRRDKEQGEGVRATVSVKGWRDSSGMLWTPGHKVWVQSPSLALAQYMLIESAAYACAAAWGESGGATTTMQLVDPRAHGGKAGQVNDSGPSWGFDNPEAE